jgi:hypothetical protein
MKKLLQVFSIFGMVLLMSGFTGSAVCESLVQNLAATKEDHRAVGKLSLDKDKLFASKIEKVQTKEFTIKDTSKLTKLLVDINVGNISVIPWDKNTIKVKMKNDIVVDRKEDLKVVLDAVDLMSERNRKNLSLHAVKKGTDESIWNWLYKNIGLYNLSVELEISVPNNIQNYALYAKVGTITLDHLKANIKAKTEIGNITVRNMEFINKCSLMSTTGSIDCSIAKKVSSKSTVLASTHAGDVIVNMNKHSVKIRKHKKSVAWEELHCNVEDKCQITARTDVGSIDMTNGRK